MKNIIVKILFSLIAGSLLLSCEKEIDPVYRQRMRDFVECISSYAKSKDSSFIIIPQNGHQLVKLSEDPGADPDYIYLSAIDGAGQEDLYYGFKKDNEKTPGDETEYLLTFLSICETSAIEVFTTDYCWTEEKVDDSYMKNRAEGFISFAAPDRELNRIPDYPPEPNDVSDSDILQLADAGNFLYIINPDRFTTRKAYIGSLAATNYDMIIMDLFKADTAFTRDELSILKTKQNGGKRLIICYMSIGEAEDYRYYWNPDWKNEPPGWLEKENPRWDGNYKVRYWMAEWHSIIYGNNNSYLDRIIESGFDGVYLDIIDAFEYFE